MLPRWKKTLAFLLVLLLVLSVFTGCKKKEEPPVKTGEQKEEPAKEEPKQEPAKEEPAKEEPKQEPAKETQGTVKFTDSTGREVELPAKIDRLVPSGPLAQMVLFAIAPEKMVGVGTPWPKSAEAYFGEYFKLPELGQVYGGKGELNLEELLAAKPQIIIDVGEPKKTIKEDMAQIQEQTGIPTIHITADLKTMGDAYRTLGKILGKEDVGEKLASFCEGTYKDITAMMEKIPAEERPSLLLLLGEKGTNVMPEGSFQAEVINTLSRNIAVLENPSAKGSGQEVDMEQILLWNPDIILFGPKSVYAKVAEDSTWNQLQAITNKKFVEVPSVPYNWVASPPSVQRYLGMLWLADLLYPDKVQYKLYDKVKEYFELFYHHQLTEEEFKDILKKSSFPQ